jgi:L-fucose/D-arabinose isomerase
MLTPETLGRQIRIYLAMEQVNKEKGFDFCGLKGQRELTEHYTLGDVPEMLMNDPYDWRGPKEPMVCATEADCLRRSHSAAAEVHFRRTPDPVYGRPPVSSGTGHLGLVQLRQPCQLVCQPELRSRKRTSRRSASTRRLSSISRRVERRSSSTLLPGEMTFCRLGLWDEKPFMFITKGEALELPAEQRKEINESDQPDLAARPREARGPVRRVPLPLPLQPRQGVIGDKVRALNYLCEIAGITPVIGIESRRYGSGCDSGC